LQCSLLAFKGSKVGDKNSSSVAVAQRLVQVFNTTERSEHRKLWLALAINALRLATTDEKAAAGAGKGQGPDFRKDYLPFAGIFDDNSNLVTPQVAVKVAQRANLWPLVVETILKEPLASAALIKAAVEVGADLGAELAFGLAAAAVVAGVSDKAGKWRPVEVNDVTTLIDLSLGKAAGANGNEAAVDLKGHRMLACLYFLYLGLKTCESVQDDEIDGVKIEKILVTSSATGSGFCHNDGVWASMSGDFYSSNKGDSRHDNDHVNVAKEEEASSGAARKAIVAHLLAKYEEIAAEICLETWMDFVELPAPSGNPFVNLWFWEEEEEQQQQPSNLQLWLAHFAHEVKQMLTSSTLEGFAGQLQSSKVVSMLSCFAKKYDRIIELNLDQLSTAEIVDAATEISNDEKKKESTEEQQKQQAESWKVQAYFSHLLDNTDNGHWQQVLKDSKALAFVLAAVHHATDAHCDLFFKAAAASAIQSSGKPREKDEKAIVEIFLKSLEIGKRRDLAKQFLIQRSSPNGDNLSVNLARDSLANDMRTFVNKLTAIGGSETNADSAAIPSSFDSELEVLILTLQSASKTVDFLVSEAASGDKGKIEAIAQVMRLIPQQTLLHHKIRLADRIAKFEFPANVDRNRFEEYLIGLAVKLAQNSGAFQQALVEKLMADLLHDDDDVTGNHCNDVMGNANDVIDFKGLAMLEALLKGCDHELDGEPVAFGLCAIATKLYASKSAEKLQWLSVILNLIHQRGKLAGEKKESASRGGSFDLACELLLHPDLRPYFVSVEESSEEGRKRSLREKVKNGFFREETNDENFDGSENSDQLGELLAILPSLMDREWQVLFAVVDWRMVLSAATTLVSSSGKGDAICDRKTAFSICQQVARNLKPHTKKIAENNEQEVSLLLEKTEAVFRLIFALASSDDDVTGMMTSSDVEPLEMCALNLISQLLNHEGSDVATARALFPWICSLANSDTKSAMISKLQQFLADRQTK